MISCPMWSPKESYATGHALYGPVGRAVSRPIEGLVGMSGSQCIREVAACLLKDDAAETVTKEHYWTVRAALKSFSNNLFPEPQVVIYTFLATLSLFNRSRATSIRPCVVVSKATLEL